MVHNAANAGWSRTRARNRCAVLFKTPYLCQLLGPNVHRDDLGAPDTVGKPSACTYSSDASEYYFKAVAISPLTMRSRTGTELRSSSVPDNSLGGNKVYRMRMGKSHADLAAIVHCNGPRCVCTVSTVLLRGIQVLSRELSALRAQAVISAMLDWQQSDRCSTCQSQGHCQGTRMLCAERGKGAGCQKLEVQGPLHEPDMYSTPGRERRLSTPTLSQRPQKPALTSLLAASEPGFTW